MGTRVFADGPWHGFRSYDSSPDEPRPMDLVLELSGSALGGSGKDDDGAFTLAGSISEAGEVKLEQRYPSPPKVIELDGSFDGRSGKVSGRWRVEGRRHGVFELSPGTRKPARPKERALPPPVTLPEDPERLEALLGTALAQRDLPFVAEGYDEAFAALKAFAARHRFTPARTVDEPMQRLEDAHRKLQETLRAPLSRQTHATAREQAHEIASRADQVAQAVAQLVPVRLTLDAASRQELAQLVATWLVELRREAGRSRNTVYVTAELGHLLAKVEPQLG